MIQPEGGMPISQSPPKETVLVVDDEREVLALVADILRANGYTVLSASDPREALRLARTRSEPIHLLLTDVVMPFMNGGELAEELRTIRPGVKVLFMSAYTTDVVEDYGIQISPGESFMVKPFTVVDLARKVRNVLDYQSPFSKPNRR
jgi:two-component system cell cycle sensor histidine kinase/response regulator CckA